jgi:hypothetical protein
VSWIFDQADSIGIGNDHGCAATVPAKRMNPDHAVDHADPAAFAL